jgi:hypothetical protein
MSGIDKKLGASSNINVSPLFKYLKCIDNSDPLRIARVRALDVELKEVDKTSEDPKLVPWSVDDPHVYKSFLPYHINVVPSVDEMIFYFKQDSSKTNLDKIYCGPVLSHPSYVKGEKYESAQVMTNKGKAGNQGEPYLLGDVNSDVPLSPDINKKGVFPHPDDIAILGRENTEIVLGMREYVIPSEENPLAGWYPQILIRSGKFKKVSDSQIPDRYDKPSFIQINTFDKTYRNVEKPTSKTDSTDTYLKHIIVYDIDYTTLNQDSNMSGHVSLYKVNSGGNTESGQVMASDMNPEKFIEGITFLPDDNNYLIRSNFSGLNRRQVARHIEKFINAIDDNDRPKVESLMSHPDSVTDWPTTIHPLYFVPTIQLTNYSKDIGNPNTHNDNALWIMSKVQLKGVSSKGFGLAMTNNPGERDIVVETSTVMEPVSEVFEGRQGIVSIGTDKIFLFSHNITELGKINLSDSPYGISQEKYISDIEVKTNSLVRGEELMKLLKVIVNFMASHTHAYHGLAPVKQSWDGTRVEDLYRLLNNADKKILNQNIRIN